MNKVKFGIVGTGQIVTKAHIPNLNSIETAEITAICGRREEPLNNALSLCKNKDTKGFLDFDEFLKNGDFDAVIIAYPNHLHVKLALKCIEAKKAVFLEKPLATNTLDLKTIVSATKKSGSILQVGYEFYYSTLFQKAFELVDSGKLGQVKMITTKEIRFPLKSGWRNSIKLSGGVMLEKNSHYLHLFNVFAKSRAKDVFSVAQKAVNLESELFDNSMTIINYENGIKASLIMCLMDTFRESYIFEVFGTEGRLYIDIKEATIKYYSFTKNKESLITIDASTEEPEAMHPGTRKQLIEFIETINNNKDILVDVDEAAEVTLLALAIEQSILDNKIVKISSFGDVL